MLALNKSFGGNPSIIEAIGEDEDKLISLIPDSFILFDGSWILESDLEWFKNNEPDDGREGPYYFISSTNIKIIK